MHRKSLHLIALILILSLIEIGKGANLDPGLIGWWTFEEGSGTVAKDITGKSVDGVFTSDVSWGRDAEHGGILSFNGTETVPEYVFIDGHFNVPVYTMSLWFRVDGTSTAHQDVLSAYATGVRHGILLEVRTDGVLRYLHRYPLGTGGGSNIYTTTKYVDGAWYHATMVKSLTDIALYINGEEVGRTADVSKFNPGDTFGIALGTLDNERATDKRCLQGAIDDVRIYDRPISQEEIKAAMEAEPWPHAWGPAPADGSLHPDTWVNLSWVSGAFAVSHDMYFGDSFDGVSAATTDSPEFQGNQTLTFLVVGFPGFAFPEGLVPGTTYYWRIDEVNDLNPDSPWKGDVWSFTVPSKKAYVPDPPSGAKFIDTNVILTWTSGFGARLHTVYFGDDPDVIANAAGGLTQIGKTYTPSGLEAGKTYYWRVDEFDGATTHKGDLWSFTTAGTGGGVRADYYKGTGFGVHVLTRVDPQIDFTWGLAEPDPAVGADNFSVRWTGEIEAAFTEAYTFYTNSDDGVRLWINGQQLVDNWTDHTNTENSGRINLVAGQVYTLRMEYYDRSDEAVAQLLWSSPHTPRQIIPQAALSLPVRANSPSPAVTAEGIRLTSILTWNAGDYAASHDVYFGTDENAVISATTASPEYKGSKTLGDESYDPGKLQWYTTYYWRIDEVNDLRADSPWVGNIWSFTTGDFLVVDDFELYNDIDPPDAASNRIFESWIDGFGTTTNGALVGNDLPPYAAQNIVHGGRQSMPYLYDNNLKTSEATLTLISPRDWTEEGVTELSLWFTGDAANAPEPMFVALNGTAVVYHDDPAATQMSGWNEWVIPLQAFADQGVNLTNVNTITIGFGTKNSPAAGGTGTMYFDDIRLYRPRTAP